MKNMANILQKVIHIFIKVFNFCMIYDYYKIMFIFIYIHISNKFSIEQYIFVVLLGYEHITLMKHYSLINHCL